MELFINMVVSLFVGASLQVLLGADMVQVMLVWWTVTLYGKICVLVREVKKNESKNK